MTAGRQPAERKLQTSVPPGMVRAPAAMACSAAASTAGQSQAGPGGRTAAACTAAEMAASAGSRSSCKLRWQPSGIYHSCITYIMGKLPNGLT